MVKHLGDITKINGAEIEPVWCVTGGSPCQDLSVAGKRAGLAGARSGLFMEQVRIVKEMRERDKRAGRTGEMVRPRFLVWENVPGAFSSNFKDGFGDFGAVLEEVCRIAEPGFSLPRLQGKQKWTKAGAIDGDGWSVAWRTHDAQYWGVPQRRRRISLVADFGGQCAGEILFVSEGLSGYSAEGFRAWQTAAGTAEEGTGASGCFGIDGYNSTVDDVASTLGVNYGIDRAAFNQGKNAQFGFAVEEEVEPTIVAKGPGAVGQPRFSSSKASFFTEAAEELANTLVATDYKDPPIVNDKAFGFYPQMKAESMCMTEEKSVALVNGTNPGFQNGVIEPEYIVRRLMPIECERLQGFPDHWTDIGEWVDSKGKKHKDADSPRYKALGNSIALPFWYWMLNRMKNYLPEGATMGSLFDGIGGFPLCWERIHGKGTARWASEIEEFPIAVTKLRFPEKEGICL